MNQNIQNIAENIKDLVEGPFFIEQYGRLLVEDEVALKTLSEEGRNLSSDKVRDYEQLAAKLFNMIFVICQLEYDKEKAKSLVEDMIREGTYSANSFNLEMIIQDKLQKIDEYYREDTKEKMIERLKHGMSVHFTTPLIAEAIKKDGEMKPFSGIFSDEEKHQILKAGEEQARNDPELIEKPLLRIGRTLNLGFSISQGISMSAQTNGFWMYHTPEALTFLYGSNVMTRNKEGAIEYIERCTDKIEETEKGKVQDMLMKTWNRFIGEEQCQAAILIPRDALEYEKVTYWNENPPRVEEIRPFRTQNFSWIDYEEESRYTKPIKATNLFFAKVPTIANLHQQLDFAVLKEEASRLSSLAASAKLAENELKWLFYMEQDLKDLFDQENTPEVAKEGGDIGE